MKKRMLFLSAGLIFLSALYCSRQAATSDPLVETNEQKDERMAWWREARFGMFIHWGVYSVPAGVYHGQNVGGIGEWIMNNAKIPVSEYREYAKSFNPVKYDPDAWVRLAKDAGMKYIIITSKHHDGFALFDSKATEWDVVDATPYGKDLLKPLSEACAKYGIKLGFYYSQSQDWNHPGGSAIGGHWDKMQDGDMDEYVRNIAVPQVREILSNYGPISIIWWDTPNDMTREQADLLLPLLKLQPGIIQNNRLGGGYEGDTETPEQFVPAEGFPGRDWETCMTMNDTWGYKSTDHNWKSTESLIRNLADIASKGGNYLLNVGPTSEGLIPEASIEKLQAIGRWMRVNGEAIHATRSGPFKTLSWGRCTQVSVRGGTRLYLIIFDWPKDGKLVLPGISNKPKKAVLLSDPAFNMKMKRYEDAIVISVPEAAPDSVASVIMLDVKGKPKVTDPPVIRSDFHSFVDSLQVTIESPEKELTVRYTLDETDPSASSQVSEGPIVLTQTATVSARCFKGGKPVSGTVHSEFVKAVPSPASSVPRPAPGLRCAIYEGEWDVLPDFNTLKPARKGISSNFQIAPRPKDDNFGFVFDGYIDVPATGLFLFYTESDDGSRLYIDGKETVQNDGLHAMIENRGEAALSKGLHSIRVEFFERTGGEGLVVSWRGPGIEKQAIPDGALRH